MLITERVYIVGRGGWGGHDPISGDNDCNIYLIDGGTELALVDVGAGPAFDAVWENIKHDGLDPTKVTTVLLTHTHWDHARALPGLRKLSKATVHAHAVAAQATEDLHPHLGAGPAVKELGAARARRAFRVDRVVKDGDTVKVGDLAFEVLELPGHTPDGLGYVLTLGGQGSLFAGDTAIGDQGQTRGCLGWLDVHWGSDLKAYSRSLGRLGRRKFDLLLPGHGRWIMGRDRVTRSLRNCRERLERFRRFPQLGSMIPLRP